MALRPIAHPSASISAFRMEEPYIVMATQNPVESYGTFPLPEAQLDRFFMKMKLGYMTEEQEKQIMGREDAKDIIDRLSVCNPTPGAGGHLLLRLAPLQHCANAGEAAQA